MKVIYRGLDALDVAFKGRTPKDLLAKLEEAKEQAIKEIGKVTITHNGVRMAVAETGGPGGYAFRCDTGPDGATWFFKRPKAGDPWGVRVSVKALALALYDLGGVRARLYEFLDALEILVPPGGESIGRVDYAVDFLASDFVLEPEHFVMHSHTSRKDHKELSPMVIHGTSGCFTSVTVGKMPNRQVIVYDKRKEVVDKRKVYWWEIWNASQAKRGEPPLGPKDQEGPQVWRVELRAGKDHLKKIWGGKSWGYLDDKLGSLLLKTLDDVRYVTPGSDSNRSRWPNHEIWGYVRNEVEGDLFEMMCPLDPNAVRKVLREEMDHMLRRQIKGLAATYAVVSGRSPSDWGETPGLIQEALREDIQARPADFQDRIRRAGERFVFLDLRPSGEGNNEGAMVP